MSSAGGESLVNKYDVDVQIAPNIWKKVGEIDEFDLQLGRLPLPVSTRIKQSGSMRYRILDSEGNLVSQVDLTKGMELLGFI